MTYIPIDKKARVLNREGNIIHMATVMYCINDKYPGTTAIASMLTGKIETYIIEHILYKTDKDCFIDKEYSGIKYTTPYTRLSLVNGKSADVINLAEYCGRI